jgi:tripartite-type tricarboxylate transporter receptor subunit TctC
MDNMIKAVDRRAFVLGAGTMLAGVAWPASAQTEYPTRPVHFIVPSGAGSGTDIITRILGDKLSRKWGQPVVVENRAGASGLIGTQFTAQSPPDGYTLCMGFTGPLAASPAFLKAVSYDPLKDLAPITLVDSSPAVLVVTNDLPVKSVQELIAYAKANPGTLTFGSAGQGTIGHVSGELFNQKAGTKMLHVPYKDVSQAVTDVVGGHLKVLFHVAPALMPLAKSGQIRALGVTSLKKWALTPDLPSIAEVALPGYEASVWHGVVAAGGTPQWLVDKLHQDIVGVMRADDVREQFTKQWIEPLGTTPAEFRAFMKSELENYVKVAENTSPEQH